MLEIKVKIVKQADNVNRQNDPLLGIWKGVGTSLAKLFGKGNEWLTLESPVNSDTTSMMNLEQYGKIRVSASFFPIYMHNSNEVDGFLLFLLICFFRFGHF